MRARSSARKGELWSNGVLEIPLCREAQVGLLLEGTLAQGKGPHALVVEGGRVLWQGRCGGRGGLGEGHGEGNPGLGLHQRLLPAPEDRNLFLRALRVEP